MDIKPIKNQKEYKAALKAIEELWGAKRHTSKGDLLEVLSILVEDYEKKHYPIYPPDPVEEDAEDLTVFEKRAKEPTVTLEDLLKK
jgi:antitoxin component HigA of HigAB toxin-antitoxin module